MRLKHARRGWRRLLVPVAVAMLTGCGSSALSAGQLRSEAAGICASAQVRTDRIQPPVSPATGASFLARGLEVLKPELTRLQRLRPPSDLAPVYDSSLRAFSRKLSTLHSTVSQLDAGADPVSAIDSLQQQLAPIESEEDSGWRTLQIPACLNR